MLPVMPVHAVSIAILFMGFVCGEHSAPESNNADHSRKITNPYLSHIFHMYGSHGTISFEGLEHLMQSLGLGGLRIEHAVDKHRPDGYQVPDFLSGISADGYVSGDGDLTDNAPSDPLGKSCLSPINLIRIYDPKALNGSASKQSAVYHASPEADASDAGDEKPNGSVKRLEFDDADENLDYLSNIQITPATFMNMCPALLVQIEQRSCQDQRSDDGKHVASQLEFRHGQTDDHDHDHDDDHDRPPPKAKAAKQISAYAWIAAFVSVTIISLCGLVGIGMVPLTRFAAYHDILRFMIAIAIGTLCGDALMHLLPHALVPHTGEPTNDHLKHGGGQEGGAHNHNTDAVWLFGCAFFTALLMYAIEALLPLTGETGHGHSHSHQLPEKTPPNSPTQTHCRQSNEHMDRSNNCGSCEDLDNDLESSKKNNEENIMVKDTKSKIRPALTPVAFMVVIGDGLHNLTDGMAIGAAFGVDPVTGMATAFAVLCHELPHELGDFALLLQTGVSLRRAIFLNIVSSVLSFVGMIVGLLIVGMDTSFVRWIYAGTAGTFLYIALADLVPELNRGRLTFKMVVIQTLGILIGGIIMLLIGLYEDNLRVLFEWS